MADVLKVLGQLDPTAAVLTDLYTVPASTSTLTNTLTVCNRSSSSGSFRVSIAVGGAADDVKQYIYYDVPIIGNDTFAETMGLTLATGDKVRVFTSSGNISFGLWGIEIT